MLKERTARYASLVTILIGAAMPAVLYLRTLAPTVGERDSFEFQVVSYTLGIAHPTGYPLYLLLGKLFTFIPIGSVAYRVNLLSAVGAVGAVVLIYLIAHHITKAQFAALVAALTFAVSPIFWSQAVVAEVYTLNALLVAGLLYWTLLPDEHRFGKLEFGFLLMGFGLAHHRTIILLAPLLIWKFANAQIGKSANQQIGNLGKSLVCLTAPLLFYLYIPIRWAQTHDAALTWARFSAIVFGDQFSQAVRFAALWNDSKRYEIVTRLFMAQFTAVGIALGIGGLLWLLWRHRRAALLTLVAFAPYITFSLIYYVSDVAVFAIPAYLIFALWIGAGIAAILQGRVYLEKRFFADNLFLGGLSRLCVGATLILPASLVITNFTANDHSADWEMYRWGKEVLEMPLEHNAAIIADIDRMAPLHYLQIVEGMRPDTETILPPNEELARREIQYRVAAGQPVYLARFVPNLVEQYHFRSLGALVEVSTQPLTAIPTETPSDASIITRDVAFGHGIELRGKSVVMNTDCIEVTLYWQATAHPDDNYEVELRLVSENGHVWLQKRTHPVNGMYPTAGWRAGEIIPDYHELCAEYPIPPGAYELTLQVLSPFENAGLKVQGTDKDYAVLQAFTTAIPALSPEEIAKKYTERRVVLNSEIALLGYDWSKLVRGGKTAPLTLYWQKRNNKDTNYEVVIELVDNTGAVRHHEVYPFLYGEHPTSRWRAGEIWVDTYDLPIPNTDVERIGWRAGITALDDETVLWANDKPYVFSKVQQHVAVQGEQERAVNLGDKVMLLGYQFDRRQVREGAGETMKLTLVWQCLRKMERDYTVFVQALDENDKIWGQADAEPVYGTYPTSQWKEGEIIEDVHELQMQKRAPRQRFSVQIGMYHLETMARLPVLDEEGHPIDDRVYLGQVEVERNREE